MSNINKELQLDEKTYFLHQEELVDLNYAFKFQHKVDHVDTNADSDVLHSSNTVPIDERKNKTMESVNLENDQKVSENHRRQKPLKCAICDGEFELKTKLQKHIESDHGKKVSLDSI